MGYISVEDPDSGWIITQDPDPGSECLEKFYFGLKYLNSLMRIRDSGSRIRDRKNSDPGRSVYISVLQYSLAKLWYYRGRAWCLRRCCPAPQQRSPLPPPPPSYCHPSYGPLPPNPAALNSSADQDIFHSLVFFIRRLCGMGDIRKGQRSSSHSLSIYRDRDE